MQRPQASARVRTPTTPDFACYLPNTAIGWKQPNGFFYPPSFHSNNLFFDDVDIRHYVIDAPFAPGTYLENASVKEARVPRPSPGQAELRLLHARVLRMVPGTKGASMT